MKKLFTLLLSAILIAGFLPTTAASFTVTAGNLHFSPSDLTINAGDTIIWTWTEGSHTTTSTQIPVGAVAWDQGINSNSPVFMYSPAIAGSYNYVCSPHASMGMTGHFTVINTSGISQHVLNGATLNGALLNPDLLLVQFVLPSPTLVTVSLYNLIGNNVSTFLMNARQPAGSYEEKFLLPSLRSGLYILQLQTADGLLTKRILVP
jgi:plastocyanin